MSTAIAHVEIRSEQDVVCARQRARRIALLLGFDSNDQTRISTAVSEIAHNAFLYGGGGGAEFMLEGMARSQVFAITVRDRGPGITDVQAVLEGRYNSSTGMGIGIIGSCRLMDQFHISTETGKGTEVFLGKTLPPTTPEITPAVVRQIVEGLEVTGTESPLEEIRLQNQALLRTMHELRSRREELEITNRGVLALHTELDEKIIQLGRVGQELRESEERFRITLENSPVVIFNQDRELCYTWMYNPQPGFEPETVLGKTDADVFAVDEAARLIEIKRRVLQTGVPARKEVRITVGGQVFLYDLTTEPLRDASGGIVGVASVLVDITERKVAEEELAARTLQLEAVRAVAREIARELNLPALLQLITRRAGELLGGASGSFYLWDEGAQCLIPIGWSGESPPGERQSRHLAEGLVGAVAERREAMFVNDYRTSRFALPVVIAHSDITAAVAVPLLYRERLLGVLVLNDQGAPRRFSAQDQDLLTLLGDHAAIAIENARLYQQTQEHAVALEGRVAARTAELAVVNQELRTASQHKSAFLANMSHELRTPLNSILGFAQLLQEQTTELFSTRQTRFLTNIYTSGQHLLTLINDILDLSKVEAGKITLELVPLVVAETLEDLLVITRGLAYKKGQTVQVEIAPNLPVLTADPVRFKQIFFNLVSNAVKFTPEGGTITVAARRISNFQFPISNYPNQNPAPQSQSANQNAQLLDFLEIAVSDTGAGIRAADLPKLFHEFTQLETTAAQAHEGTGLGLALTKRLVGLHGGTVTAASEGEGKGSTFTVRLPMDGAGDGDQ